MNADDLTVPMCHPGHRENAADYVSLNSHMCTHMCVGRGGDGMGWVRWVGVGGRLSSMYTHKHPPGNGSHPGNIYLCW